jgi:DNA-binding winged helix-turn-helix (wHTH) protein/tetratricopeptide (TPR) repeat protein
VKTVAFGPFRLDPVQRLLSRPGATIALRPKTLEVLLLLLRRPGEVVAKDELLATVWAGTAVSEYVLTTCISELRAALGDRSKPPRFLRTVHRTGYRLAVDDPSLSTSADDVTDPPGMVGRERELARLRAALQQSHLGRRQIVFITGEMGIGKTTLANHFVTSCDGIVARGQCVERFGAGEPYMPVLEAIGRLGRGEHERRVIDVMRRHAPAWLAAIPGLLPPEQRVVLRRETPAQTQESMLRQIADGFEALTEHQSMVLLLEDLHLSDHATLELLAALALREGPAHLIIVGTFRDAEVFPASSPFHRLRQQLLLHRQCEEIALAALDGGAIEDYLATRFAGLAIPAGLASTIRRRTEGNPLYIARLIDHLLEEDVMAVDRAAGVIRLRDADLGRHVPRTLRAMIEQRTDGLAPDEREVLEAASVVGEQFWSAGVAAALGCDRETVERQCTQLVRHHGFLVVDQGADAAPSALGARYGFSHALYQQVLYERIEVTRRQRAHAAIGAALRDAWGERAGDVAAELASHFERGGDAASAVGFFDRAAAAAAGSGANREAVGYIDRALALLEPGGDERRLDLLMMRGPAALAVSGYGSVDVHDNYRRALALARQLDNPMRQMSCLIALSTCQQTRGSLDDGEDLAIELIRTGERIGLPAPLLAQLHNPLSQVRMYKGAVEESLALADAAVAAMQMFPMPPTPPDGRGALWADPSVMLHCQHGAVSFAAGRLAQAAVAVDAALRIARELRHPFNQASACTFAALYEDTMGRWGRAAVIAEEAIDAARAYDFPFWRGIAQIFRGHAMARGGDVQGGLACLREGIEVWGSTGARLATSNHLNLLADACLIAGDLPAARAALEGAETHATNTGERVFLAETYRLQAACADADRAVALLHRAIETSRGQGTRLWELRSALALHRLRGSDESHRQLTAVCEAFDGEPETRDVAEARAALAQEN